MKKIIPCGTKVTTVLGSIEGRITGITIRFDAVSYEVSYFNREMERREVWMNESEFITTDETKFKIGFVK